MLEGTPAPVSADPAPGGRDPGGRYPRGERAPGRERARGSTPPSYLGKALAGGLLIALGVAAGWSALHFEWKLVLGFALGALVTVVAIPRPFAGFVFFVIALPLLEFLPPEMGAFKGLNALNLVMAVVVVSWLTHSLRGGRSLLPGHPVSLAILAFAGVLVLSMAQTAQDPPQRGMAGAFEDLKVCLTSFSPFFLTLGIARTERERLIVLRAVLAMVIVVALHAFLFYLKDIAEGAPPQRIRVSGIMGQPNDFGGYLAMYVPAMLMIGLGDRRSFWRLFMIAGGCLCFFVLLTTQSRGGILACVLALVVLGFMRDRRLLILLVPAALLAPFWLPETVVERFNETRVVEDETGEERLDDSSEARLEVWAGGMLLFERSPVFGHGFGTFVHALRNSSFRGTVRSPHSTYVKTLAENGLVGMIALLALLLAVMRLSLKPRPGESLFDTRLRNGLLGGVLALTVVNFFGTRFYNIGAIGYFWVLAGLAAGIGTGSRPVAAASRAA